MTKEYFMWTLTYWCSDVTTPVIFLGSSNILEQKCPRRCCFLLWLSHNLCDFNMNNGNTCIHNCRNTIQMSCMKAIYPYMQNLTQEAFEQLISVQVDRTVKSLVSMTYLHNNGYRKLQIVRKLKRLERFSFIDACRHQSRTNALSATPEKQMFTQSCVSKISLGINGFLLFILQNMASFVCIFIWKIIQELTVSKCSWNSLSILILKCKRWVPNSGLLYVGRIKLNTGTDTTCTFDKNGIFSRIIYQRNKKMVQIMSK